MAYKTNIKPRILRLTLYKNYFRDILNGQKKVEYRNVSEYWHRRLDGKMFDIIEFRNGYYPDAPVIRAEFKGIERKGSFYHIHIGQILSTKNIYMLTCENPKVIRAERIRKKVYDTAITLHHQGVSNSIHEACNTVASEFGLAPSTIEDMYFGRIRGRIEPQRLQRTQK